MAPLFERQDPLRIEGELTDQQDLEAVGRGRRVGTLSESAVVLNLVDPSADARVEAERLAHGEARPVRVDAPERLADNLVPLIGMVHPFA